MRIKQYRGYWYAVDIIDGQTKRVSLRTKDKSEAEQRFADLRASGPRTTIREIMAAYLAEKDQTAADGERLRYAWKRLEPHFGALRPDQVTREECRAYIASRDVSPSTIQKELRTLRAGLRWQDPHTPAVFVVPPSAPPKDRSLDRAEYKKLLRAAKHEHIRLFITLALASAARSDALLSLTWDRVDFERGLIALGEGKGKGRATVPMTNTARQALLNARALAVSDYVIEYAGRRVGSIKKGFSAACRRAKIEGVTPHTLRHTAAVWMAEAGTPMSEISQYLGHSDSRITERVYARYSPAYLRGAANALEI